jgi:PIN domain nuclease of toxin-antitoxin system
VQCHITLDDEISIEALRFSKVTKPYGLSLGDRYCLALGKLLNVPVYTADRVWKELESQIGVTIKLIR